MPLSRARRTLSGNRLVDFIDEELQNDSLLDLSTDGLNLLNMLTLIVDIEYRVQHGGSLDRKRYIESPELNDQVLADQLPPVDDVGPAKPSSTGGIWL